MTEFGNVRFGGRKDPIRLNPAAGDAIAERIILFEKKLDLRLYPVGIWPESGFWSSDDEAPIYVLVDEKGVVYTFEADVLRPLASSFDRAVEYFVRRDWREKRDDLQTIDMSNKIWALEDQECEPDLLEKAE